MSIRDRLLEQIEQVDTDLDDLDGEVAQGELDADTAAALRDTYRAERSQLVEELAAIGPEQSRGPDRRRAIWGFVITAVAMAAITVLLFNVVDDRAPGELATGGITSDVVSGDVDLDAITNEQMEEVIADNPNIVGMRVALARRYFDEGALSQSLEHFLVVLELDPTNHEALASVGWMAFLSDEYETGESYVLRALDAAPGYPDALWFLANIRIGAGDPDGAVAPLEELLAWEGLAPEVRDAATTMLETIRG